VPAPSTGPRPRLRLGVDGCDHRRPPRPGVSRAYTAAPPLVRPAGAGAYSIVLDTSCGRIVIAPDGQGGPAADVFAALAERRFYDGLAFFRVVPGYFVQSGDPKDTGAGGPGFTVQGTAPARGTTYRLGDVAMTKTRQQPAGTAGSQFLIVTGAAAAKAVSPIYAIVGHVNEAASRETLRRLDALGVGDGPPLRSLYIWRARVVAG
jgi:peptidyl-prolyl cis-trans isomerase B (cyclophilin B)